MADAQPLVAGDDYFGLGADQFVSPQKIALGKYVSSENTISRGGIVQTRPGSRSMLTLPDGALQGATLFKPASGIAHIVFAVAGSIYVSQYPFTSYRKLDNLQFSASSPFVSWAVCLKSTDYDAQGVLYFIENPYSVLVMQDGKTRAGYWDGSVSGHLNPTPSPTTITVPGYDETPLGLWMCWANNRLWVSRGNQIFASDIGNPLKFTEAQYLNEGRAFYLPENCTGIAATTDQQGIICFTEQTGTFLESSIQDRTQWLSTPNFQKTVLPSVGCVSPRSIVTQYGLLWWYSSRGLINQDDALRANITSRLNIQDNPMFATKAHMSFNLVGVCGCAYENMLLMSVPYGDTLNRRTMVLDQSLTDANGSPVNAWASSWTGWRPVEWATGVVNGEERVFMASVDYDGRNRIWEVGTSDKTDNGTPITCNLITREHLFGSRDFKTMHYVETELCNINSDLSFMVSVAGIRGAWQPLARKEIVSTHGQIYGDSIYGTDGNEFMGTSLQTRVLRSQNAINASECNSACVETEQFSGLIDKAFSIMFTWSGECGVSAYRVFSNPEVLQLNGNCETNEDGPHTLNDEGCGALDEFSDGTPFEVFTATKSYAEVNQVTALPIVATVTATSIISQADADRKASLSAKAYVQAQL